MMKKDGKDSPFDMLPLLLLGGGAGDKLFEGIFDEDLNDDADDADDAE